MTITVTLADDHALLRQGLTPLLAQEHDIRLLDQASDGDQALRQIQQHQPDVAIIDVGMPLLSGIDVAHAVQDSRLPTRVLLLTMHNDPCAATNALQAGAAGYVVKDSLFEELLLAVRILAAGGTFMTPSLRHRLLDLQRQGCSTAALSAREREVVRLIALGNGSKEIARILDLSPRTVETYRKRLMEKLGVNSLAEVVRYALRTGMVS